MNTTSVPGARCEPRGSRAAGSWPLKTVTCDATPRCVIGMPDAAGTACSEETPGTTSNRTPRLGERECLLAAASEDERVAALEADDLEPAAPVGDEQVVDRGLVERLAGDAESLGRRLRDELGSDETVVDEHVAAAQRARARGR